MYRRCSAVAVVIAALTAPVGAQNGVHEITIPAGSLDFALQLLARQTGITVGGTDRSLLHYPRARPAWSVYRGRSIARLLADTRYEALPAGPNAFRLARPAEPIPQPRAQAPAPGPARRSPPAPPPPPIIVTASKRALPLENFPGGATVVDFSHALPVQEAGGIEDVLATLPVTGSTSLGPGRNKLFVRGIADSSFNGPTQSTIGLYFGEQRLIYSAPNPELRMYDVDRVELLEGPQGTLYGAGALGGLVRIVPRPPEPGEWSGSVWGAAALTAHGEAGFDVAGSVNAPLGDRAAARVLLYQGRLGGYIDDAQRDLSDVNRTDIAGGRLGLRFETGDGWAVDLDGLFQELDTHDGQYAEAGLPPLTRRSAIAQPFDSDIAHAGVTVRKQWDNLQLVSATGIVRSSLDTRFDASRLTPTRTAFAFDQDRSIELVSHETRLSGGSESARWVAGIEALRSTDTRSNYLGDPDDPPLVSTTEDATQEAALFGETALPLTETLTATFGARLVYATTVSERRTATGTDIEPRAHLFRLLPSASLSWRIGPDMLGYLRYQQGYRTGGVSIDGSDGNQAIARFEPDELRSIEAGLRHSAAPALPLDFDGAVFWTQWSNIQADLVTKVGFPYTANIGSGRIFGLTLSATHDPDAGLGLGAAIFANDSSFDPIADEFAASNIPNVAEFGAQTHLGYSAAIGDASSIEARADLTYVGRSRLGAGPLLDMSQGDYAVVGLRLSYRSEDWTVALEADNLADTAGNRFSYGNPFLLGGQAEVTPLQPRTIRLSTRIRF